MPMRSTLPHLIWVLVLSTALPASAKIEEWKDPQGNTFKAEPAEALGPFALFRTPTGTGRRLPWRALSTADCVRFDEQAAGKPEPAARWIEANGQLTGRLRGNLRTFQTVNLVTADLNSRPEPQVLIVFYVDNAASGSWDMLGKCIDPYQALLKKYPGQAAGIQYGVNHGEQEHKDMALRANVPWPLVDYAEQRRVTSLHRLSPGRGDFALVMLTRDGVPIFAANNPVDAAITQFFVDADALLGLLRPGNPLAWPDRAHYVAALHAARHKQDTAGPLLVGDPLVPQGLRERGIRRVVATVDVGIDGKATAVTLSEESSIPAAMAPAVTKALQRSSVFAPAVDHGQFVPGTYAYRLEIAP
jgi:hypothetical protein